MNDAQSDQRRRLWPVITPLVAVLVIVCLWWIYCWFQTSTTVFVVRHADKLSPTADALSPAGITRANQLAHVLGVAGIAAIYHSNTVRAQQTAQPLATALGITPVSYPPLDVAPLVADILANHGGERVLVVGHSNTVPDVIEELGGAPGSDLDEGDYDNLFSVTRCHCTWGMPVVVNMRYGAETPP